jgi:hypothetical protein
MTVCTTVWLKKLSSKKERVSLQQIEPFDYIYFFFHERGLLMYIYLLLIFNFLCLLFFILTCWLCFNYYDFCIICKILVRGGQKDCKQNFICNNCKNCVIVNGKCTKCD